jgi:CDP-6-deoxy-D-xylo-4-hexulose-3-dehydrase
MKYNWPLNTSNFTWLDRLKICKFFLNPENRWTQGEYVKQYEKVWREFTGAIYAVMVSSGSTANTLIASYSKDIVNKPGRNIVVFPAVTWQTSVSPWIREGFVPKFIDINLEDFSLDLNALEEYLKKEGGKVHTVFATSLIGWTPDIERLYRICAKYDVNLKLDNCENSFGEYTMRDRKRHVCSRFTCSTSNYFGHQTTNGGESGLIFTDNEDEYVYYLMNRSHGLVRTLLPYSDIIPPAYFQKFSNPDVDPSFDFASLGNNFRNTDIGAFMGLLDFQRVQEYIKQRKYLYSIFEDGLDHGKFLLPISSDDLRTHVGFCLPIIARLRNSKLIEKSKQFCRDTGIEYRPIISGNLLRQTVYRKYGDFKDFPNAEYLHQYGFYVGLYPKLDAEMIRELVDYLNEI